MEFRILYLHQIDDALRQAWEAMRASSGELTSPFLTIDWVEAVARVQSDIEIGAAYDGDKPVAFMPWHRLSKNVVQCPGGIWADGEGMVATDDTDLSIADLLRGCGVSRYKFDHLVSLRNNRSCFQGICDTASMVNLGDDPQVYWDERRAAGSFLKQADRKRRKLEREVGPLRFRWHDDSPDAIEKLSLWKNRQVAKQKGQHQITDQWILSLIDVIANWQSPRMRGRLGALYAGDRPVALHLGVQAGDELTSWIPAHDISLDKYSPGMLYHVAMLEEAPQHGVKKIDLGRGENRLKSSFANEAPPRYVGAFDMRAIGRMRTAAWYTARDLAHRAPGAMALVSYGREKVASLKNRVT